MWYTYAMVKEIITVPAERLIQPSHKIKSQSKDYLAQLCKDMIDTMFEVNAAGLAAVQIDVPLRVIVINAGGQPVIFMNPVITLAVGEDVQIEQCLSLPGVEVPVKRALMIKVREKENVFTFRGPIARIMQHEIDHTNGILITHRALEVMV